MNKKTLKQYNSILIYVIKFIGVFCLCYYTTKAVIGLAAPGGYYSPFVAQYLDYVSWLKISLLKATKAILYLFGIPTQIQAGFYFIRIIGGRGVVVSMSCVGYGVYSFWIAFVAANTGSWWKKIKWIVGGLLVLWSINAVRITLFLLSINRGWPFPFGLDHHTWFNICAYLAIFLFIYLYDRTSGNKVLGKQGK